MEQPRTVSVLLIATVSALLHGALAVVFVPFLSMIMLSYGALPAPFHTVLTAEHGMIFSLASPFLYGAFGFTLGAVNAALFNLFAKMLVLRPPPVKTPVEPLEAPIAGVGEAA